MWARHSSLLSLAIAACAAGSVVIASSCSSSGNGFGDDDAGTEGGTTTATTTGLTTGTTTATGLTTGTTTAGLTTTTGTTSGTTTSILNTTTTGVTTGTTTTPATTTTTTGTTTTGTTTGTTTTPCAVTSTGGMTLSSGMSTLGMGGYAYGFSDATKTPPGGSSACVSATSFCGHGVSAVQNPANYSDPYGGGIGVNLNGAMLGYAPTGSGVMYTLSSVPAGARLLIGDATADYCYNIPAGVASGTVPWASFTLTCYSPDAGASFSPTDMPAHVEIEVPSPGAPATTPETWDFCASLSFAP